MSFINYQEKINQFNPLTRKVILISIDLFLFPISTLFVFWIMGSNPFSNDSRNSLLLILMSSIVGTSIFLFSGQYKSITRYAGSAAFYSIFFRNLLHVLVLSTLSFIFNLKIQPLGFWVLLLIFCTSTTAFYRYLIRDLIIKLRSLKKQSVVVIYGAGAAGAQLAATLRMNGRHVVAYFVDDNSLLWNRTINNISVLPPSALEKVTNQINQVFLAIPSISKTKRAKIIEFVQQKGLKVKQVPAINDLTSGRLKIDALRPIDIDDLLGRDPVAPDQNLLSEEILSSIILVTGAGGSIGSELCRQIINLEPKKLILFDNSEVSLYKINQELSNQNLKTNFIVPILGSATNSRLIKKIIEDHEVSLIFHAAAYKHVPLLEDNPLQGIYNNVFSTSCICIAAEQTSFIKKVILISSDKAVRPTNIMGASKRLSELVVQAFAYKNKDFEKKFKTCFSMVRFGNVLGSSGSVVPLFKKQIEAGGPITITDPNVMRYFMTIKEAAQLVIQASSLAEGGDVFLLDMGEPIKIWELAEKMLSLSSLAVKDSKNTKGDIEIVSTGLRPGEKLYEELLIDSNSQSTAHPLIFKANEKFISPEKLFPKIDLLKKYLLEINEKKSLELMKELVHEWDNGM
tara:strand:+ start:1024 stop:2904 length:1881 start_codon:yes stop_codon:yes gene_type:complete